MVRFANAHVIYYSIRCIRVTQESSQLRFGSRVRQDQLNFKAVAIVMELNVLIAWNHSRLKATTCRTAS